MTELWQHFASENIFWLGLTLAIYLFGHFLYRKSRFFPLLSPIIVSVVLLIAVLALSDTPYETYFEGAQTIHLLLGPATVALAIPLFDQRARLIQLFVPLVTGLVVGGVVAVLSVIVIGVLCGLSTETLLSLVPKSVTTPIAMGISEAIGGMPDLTAALVVITGIFCSVVGRGFFRLIRVSSDTAKGVALGVSAHGMGTSAAFSISPKAGAFSGLAMGISGLLTAFLAPYLGVPVLEWLTR